MISAKPLTSLPRGVSSRFNRYGGLITYKKHVWKIGTARKGREGSDYARPLGQPGPRKRAFFLRLTAVRSTAPLGFLDPGRRVVGAIIASPGSRLVHTPSRGCQPVGNPRRRRTEWQRWGSAPGKSGRPLRGSTSPRAGGDLSQSPALSPFDSSLPRESTPVNLRSQVVAMVT